MNALNELIAGGDFVNASALAEAIKVVKAAVAAPAGSALRQERLEEVYGYIDQMLIRDFSGEVTTSPNDIVQVCRNAFEPFDMAVELYSQNGDVSFYYLPADSALTFLTTALTHLDQQVPAPAVTEVDISPALATPEYAAIRKKVVADFDNQVVSMLGDVAGQPLALAAANQGGVVFADKLTDAMFFAWSCNYKHAAILEECVYDYLQSGDVALLNRK